MIPRSENIKRFSGKKVPKGADPNLSRVYGDRLLGVRYQFKFEPTTNTVRLIVHQSGKIIYPKGRSIPIGKYKSRVFTLDLLVGEAGDIPVSQICNLIGSNLESLQVKAITFTDSLKPKPEPRKVKGGSAVIEKRARRARRILKGIEIR